MVLINYAGREINAKVVYYGPGLSGKTTNLECIYASVPKDSRGKMVSMKTRQDRTLFFDFLPLELGEVHGFRTRFLLYTVPGQVFYNATRKLVLKGADAVVFVADSTEGRIHENLESLNNLRQNLEEHNLALDTIPWIIQYNKRDLPKVHTVQELEQALNPQGVPYYEAAAATGRGVYETLHAVSNLLFQRLLKELRPNSPNVGTVSGAAAGATVAGSAGSTGASLPKQSATPVPVSAVSQPADEQPSSSQQTIQASKQSETGTPSGLDPNPLLDLANPVVQTVEPVPPPVVEPNAVPKDFGEPAGNVPGEPTSEEILHTVNETSSKLGTPQSPKTSGSPFGGDDDFSDFGHTVDLALEPQAEFESEEGFIKDPLQRPQVIMQEGAVGSQPSVTPASRTYRVPVTVSASDFTSGATIRIVLDLRVDSSGKSG